MKEKDKSGGGKKEKGGMQGKVKLLVILALIFLALSGTGIGGYFAYTSWYLPKKAAVYVEQTHSDFEDTQEELSTLESDLENSFYLDTQSATGAALVKNDETISASVEVGDNLSCIAGEAGESMPAPNRLISELDDELSGYFGSAHTVGQEYKSAMQFEQEIQPHILEISKMEEKYQLLYEYDTLAELRQVPDICAEWSDDFTEVKESVQEIETVGSQEDKKEVVLAYVDQMIQFFNDISEVTEDFISPETQNSEYLMTLATYEYAKIEVRYEDQTSTYEKGLRDFDKDMREHFQSTIDELQSQEEEIEALYDEV